MGTAATIVEGNVAERCKMEGYLYYSIMLTAFVYHVVVRAIMGEGFLIAFNSMKFFLNIGMIDYTGSSKRSSDEYERSEKRLMVHKARIIEKSALEPVNIFIKTKEFIMETRERWECFEKIQSFYW